MSQYDTTFDFKIDVGHYDLYFMVQWVCLISWRLFDMNTILLDYVSVWPNVWSKNKCMSLWPIFHGPVILSYILKTIQWLNIVLILTHSHTHTDWTSDLKKFIGHYDPYFMVQWFCLTSWRLFDVWTLYFVIISQCNAAFALKQCRSQRSIFSWSSDFALNSIWWITTILFDNES